MLTLKTTVASIKEGKSIVEGSPCNYTNAVYDLRLFLGYEQPKETARVAPGAIGATTQRYAKNRAALSPLLSLCGDSVVRG